MYSEKMIPPPKAGDVYIMVDGNTRLVSDSIEWLRAAGDVLKGLGHSVSSEVKLVMIDFYRDVDELMRMSELLDELIAAKGGSSIVDLKS